jgi:hypothetical protein
MAIFIAVYHDEVVITNEIGSYVFVGMKKDHIFVERFFDTCKCDSFGAREVGLDE